MTIVREKQDEADPRDDYLDWGLATGFRFLPGERDDAMRTVGLLIQWASHEHALTGLKIAEEFGVSVPGVYGPGEKHKVRLVWAISVPVDRIEGFVNAASQHAVSLELATPVSGDGSQPSVRRERLQSEGKVLAAVMDDGCAFANDLFLLNNRPRVLWLWNQDPKAKGFPLDKSSGPSPECDFGFGGQWSADDLEDMVVTERSQERAYVAAGLPGLRRAAAHGPHITDLLCASEDWPVVFVQFPLAAIDDPSGLWLRRYALAGLHYIIECAGPNTETIVVNLSWGPQTGPHDGSSSLEKAIDELIEEQASLSPPRKLIVALPAGNSYGLRAHAETDYRNGGRLKWHIPPDGRTPAFLEFWWPDGVKPVEAKLRVVPPGGAAVDVVTGMAWIETTWFARLRKVGNTTRGFVVVHPTEYSDPAFRGLHGEWTIEFDPGSANLPGNIHAYLARADHNMGARRRAKASYLTDDALSAHRFTGPDGRHSEAPGSAIRRSGTLNGIATGKHSTVAAGYRFSDLRVADYSSSGPTRGFRKGPDYACVTDRSAAVQGIRATGVRSGTTIRLVGTSMAAPQLARLIAKGTKDVVGPNPPAETNRLGGGRLKPEERLVRKE